jgi:hypothetical protein
MLGLARVRAGQEDPELGQVGIGGPDLLARDDPSIPVGGRFGRKSCQIRARTRLAEELAPDLLARKKRRHISLYLFWRPRMKERRPGPADTDRVERAPDHRSPELFVDHELVYRSCVESPRPRPVRRNVTGARELAWRRVAVLCQPLAHGDSCRMVISGQGEVHEREA